LCSNGVSWWVPTVAKVMISDEKRIMQNENNMTKWRRRVAYFGLMVKCTPERGHNAFFFIPLQVFIML